MKTNTHFWPYLA